MFACIHILRVYIFVCKCIYICVCIFVCIHVHKSLVRRREQRKILNSVHVAHIVYCSVLLQHNVCCCEL